VFPDPIDHGNGHMTRCFKTSEQTSAEVTTHIA
jgi:hypothetical protein